MFEFHRWLSLHSDDRDDPDLAVLKERLDSAERTVEITEEIAHRKTLNLLGTQAANLL